MPAAGARPRRSWTRSPSRGLDPARVAHIILTHGHFDHAGGCAALHAALPSARVYASGVCVAAGSATATTPRSASTSRAPSTPIRAGLHAPPLPGRRRAAGWATRSRSAIVSLTVLDTPGHSDGHVVARCSTTAPARSLFSGDVVFAGGKILLQPTYDCRVMAHVAVAAEAARSRDHEPAPRPLRRLHARRPEPHRGRERLPRRAHAPASGHRARGSGFQRTSLRSSPTPSISTSTYRPARG